MSVSLGQVAFSIGLVNSVLNLSINGQVKLFEEFKFERSMVNPTHNFLWASVNDSWA